MQVNKSLLKKIVGLLSVLCLAVVMAFGLVACGGKTIASTTINAQGHLIVTYSDNSTEDLGLVVGQNGVDNVGLKDGCTHVFAEHTLKYANCSEEGLLLKVCIKCKGQEVGTTAKNDQHGTTEVKAVNGVLTEVFTAFETTDKVEIMTCSGVPYSYGKCSKCEKVTAGATAATHIHINPETAESLFVKVDGIHQNGNVCMDGEYVIYKCSNCHAVGNGENGGNAPGYEAARGYHTADATWVVTAQPTENAVGTIEGVCTLCETRQEIELPALSNTEVYGLTVPTCADVLAGAEQKKVYTIKGEDGYYGFKGEFKFACDIHHVVEYEGEDYAFEKKDTPEAYERVKTFIEAGLMSWDEGDVGDCENPKDLIINSCAECGKPVIIKAYGTHNYVDVKDAEGEIVYHEATCALGKYYEKTCTACNDTKKFFVSEKNAHVYEKVSEEKVGSDLYINLDCKNCADPVEGSTLRIKATVVKEEAATCQAPKKITYKYDLNGVETFIEVTDGEKVGHKVSVGSNVGLFFGGTVTPYDYDDVAAFIEAGKMEWDEGAPADCETPSQLIITSCEFCNKPVVINAKGTHVWSAVKDAEGEIVYHEATCDKGRYYEMVCSTCEDSKEVFEGQPAFDHAWTLDTSIDPIENADGTVTIAIKCANDGCGKTSTITGTKNEELSKAETCDTDELIVYDYKLNGQDAQIKLTGEAALGHDKIEPELTWEIVVNGQTYICKGKICDECNKLIVYSRELKVA